MLAPMTLAEPRRGWWFAFITTAASVAGGAFGYAIGWFAIDAIEPWLRQYGHWEQYQAAILQFNKWGFIAASNAAPWSYRPRS